MKKIFFVILASLSCFSAASYAQCVYPEDNVKIKFRTPIEGELSGEFTVSATKKVAFSKGNLQYTRANTSVDWSTGTWSFMDNQYDRIETIANPYCTANHANKTAIGLFGWATSGYNSKYPYMTSATSTDYGPTGTYDLVGDTYRQYDWGANPISNGGNAANVGWRLLTGDEITYMMSTRKTSTVAGVADARWVKITITIGGNAIKGLLLFPDVYTAGTPTGVNWNSAINVQDAAYTATCNATGWTALQNAGCVFLPAAGHRDGTKVTEVDAVGRYWSSSCASNTNARAIGFFVGGVAIVNSYTREQGLSVRLVIDTK